MYDFEVHLIVNFNKSENNFLKTNICIRNTRICVVDNDLQGLLRKVVSTWSCRVFRVIDQSTRVRQRRMKQFIISRGGGKQSIGFQLIDLSGKLPPQILSDAHATADF